MARLMRGALLTAALLVITACDPGASVRIRNETGRDYILVWVEAGTTGDNLSADAVSLPPSGEGLVYGHIGPPIKDWTFLLLTPTCQLVSAVRGSGTDIRLTVTAMQGWLDVTDDDIGGGELARSTDCTSP